MSFLRAETFLKIVQEQILTKKDLKETHGWLMTDIYDMEQSLRSNLKNTEKTLQDEIKKVEHKVDKLESHLKIWFLSGLGAIILAALPSLILLCK